MLNIQKRLHLAARLNETWQDLEQLAETTKTYVERLALIDPLNPGRPREVLNVKEKLRSVQNRIYRRLLLPCFEPSPVSHGGVPGRHIKTNAQTHLGSVFALTSDISAFYPSIHHSRVYRLFVESLGCSPDISRVLTRLTTFDNHLALGLVTSPIIADRIFRPIDKRLIGAAADIGLVYSRFVDDISFSASFDLSPKQCGIASLIERVVQEAGFKIQRRKHVYGRLEDGVAITKLRVRDGSIDIGKEFALELERQLSDAASLALDGEFVGPLFTEAQIRGRIFFTRWVNRGRAPRLLRKFRNINWNEHFYNGKRRGLIAHAKQLVKASLDKDCLPKDDRSEPSQLLLCDSSDVAPHDVHVVDN